MLCRTTEFSFFLSKHLKSYPLTCTENDKCCHYDTTIKWIHSLSKKKNKALTASKRAMVAGTIWIMVSNNDNQLKHKFELLQVNTRPVCFVSQNFILTATICKGFQSVKLQ